MGRIPDSEFGGTHFLGTGTYYPKTQEQADQLYEDIKSVATATPAQWAEIQSAPGFQGDKGGPSDPTQKRGGK